MVGAPDNFQSARHRGLCAHPELPRSPHRGGPLSPSKTHRHVYHLQCIMQWAQRSHECPMCFKNLELEDEDMNALLPFGEYTPAHATVASSADDSWDLERLLIRLASANHRHERRAARRAARHAAAAASQRQAAMPADRKSTRLNSSHAS